jgi:NAD(P)-dependent dehydrogenase (short-subunit alcohol dehydrogenase family)
LRLVGRSVVVTGAASGIGRATAIRCAAEGARVAVVDRDREGADRVAAEIGKSGGQARAFAVDVREEAQVRTLFHDIDAAFGRIDGLVNAAGILEGALVSVESLDEVTWDRVVDINLKGSFLVSKYAVPLLEKAGGGVLVLIASGAGVHGGSSSVAYGSSKGGVHGLSLVLAPQLAGRNIRVHGVCPGSINTPLKMRVVEKQAAAEGRDLTRAASGLGDPEGVARVLAFLLSDDADYVRGTLFTR